MRICGVNVYCYPEPFHHVEARSSLKVGVIAEHYPVHKGCELDKH